MSEATTEGIRVTVRSQYLPEYSDVAQRRYMFAYTIVIANEGDRAAQLATRHWVITDAAGTVEEVKGPGVVGQTPHLEPGESFEYTSGCMLTTPRGTMHGSYQMLRDDGEQFDAEIAPFLLIAPTADADRFLN